MRAMQSISRICTVDYSASPWATVQAVLCSFSARIDKAKECLTLVSSKVKCPLEVRGSSILLLLSSFFYEMIDSIKHSYVISSLVLKVYLEKYATIKKNLKYVAFC